jgi:hypothetical protein
VLRASADPLGELTLAQLGLDSRSGDVPADKLANQLTVVALRAVLDARYRGRWCRGSRHQATFPMAS